jgi:cytochrome c oxidase assembly protein subunit 11
MLCEVAGLQTASAEVARANALPAADVARPVTVRFDTNVPADLPWEFTASVPRVEVRTGVATEMTFHVRNRSGEPIVGRAIPTIVPWQAAQHFIKTECFCFQDQALAPGESRELTVRFMVSPKLPDEIDALTLSYTFLRHAVNPGEVQAASTNHSKG